MPDSILYGIDIQDFNQTDYSKNLYQSYIIANQETFHRSIENIKEDFNIVISNHNIEHCDNPENTFKAMVDKTKVGGMLYIATPSLSSVNFPSRKGGLNFYDDPTHQHPIDMMKLFNSQSERLECIFYTDSLRPIFWYLFGWTMEFFSKHREKIMLGTYEYYGFEQIMWIKKTGP